MSNYKPKVTALEVGIIKAKDMVGLNIMQNLNKEQATAVENKKVRKEMELECEKVRQRQVEILERNQIEMSKWERENDQKLKHSSQDRNVSRMSKKRRQKIQKI